jgi:ferredoxin
MDCGACPPGCGDGLCSGELGEDCKICPIDCIVVETVKDPAAGRLLTRMDIDMAKCMYCGLCSEPCPTGAIRHTKEFEGATPVLQSLIFRFVPPGETIVGFKVKKEDGDKMPETRARGEVAREARALGYTHNPAWYAAGLRIRVAAQAGKVDEKPATGAKNEP